MEMSSGAVCVACKHTIDAVARVCPYCGANPATGEKLDTQAIVQEIFKPKQMTRSESVIEYARSRQGFVIAGGLAIAFLILAGLHQIATNLNASAAANSQAVPLSDVADLSNQPQDNQPIPMPPLDFQYDGHPQTMRTYIVEPGAVAPAPPTPATTSAASPQTNH